MAKSPTATKRGAAKMGQTMREFGKGQLHSGSKAGPKVTGRDQAIAIGLSQARRANQKGGK